MLEIIIDDTSVKTFTSSEAGLISFDGYFGYLLAFVCYGAFTKTVDLGLVKRNLSHCSISRNMSSHRLIDTDRHFSKIYLKPFETKIYIQPRKAILYRIKSIPKVCLGPQGWKILKLRPHAGTFHKNRQTDRQTD